MTGEVPPPHRGAGLWGQALGAMLRRWNEKEWHGSRLSEFQFTLGGAARLGAVAPKDLRPPDVEQGLDLLSGAFVMGGSALHLDPPSPDPFDQPSPTRRFAIALHRYDWAPGLMAAGPEGVARALELHRAWRRLFSRWNAFSWGPEALERRVFNLGCMARALAEEGGPAEGPIIAQELRRQAVRLLGQVAAPDREAERAAAAAVAGCALAGEIGARLRDQALRRLAAILPRTVLADGGHASRSPERALELLFDLLTVDGILAQLGRAAPTAVSRAIDRLSAAVRFFTLPDGRLAAFQGGLSAAPAYVAAALAQDDLAGPPPEEAPNSGYQRLASPLLTVMVDAAAPAQRRFSVSACAQPMALEVVGGPDRLIVNCGASAAVGAPPGFRLADAASMAVLAGASTGEPLTGFVAAQLGPRLVGPSFSLTARRREAAGGVWLELAHDAFEQRLGLRQERRLHLDPQQNALRGEERFEPAVARPGSRRHLPFVVRFHLGVGVQALLSRDGRSVLVKGPSQLGWRLRTDAAQVTVEPTLIYLDDIPHASEQIVLRGQVAADVGARVRWKLAPAEG